jgi:hypothetical protein
MNSATLKSWAGTQAPKLYGLGQQAAGRAGQGVVGMGRSAGRLSGLGRRAGAMSGGLWGAFGKMKPVYGRMAATAETPLETFENEAGARVTQGYDRAKGIRSRGLKRMGVNPNSGRFDATMTSLGRDEAADVAGARVTARNQGRLANFGRLAQAGQMGLGLAGQAGQALGQAGNLEQAAGVMQGGQAQRELGLADRYEQMSNEAAEYATTESQQGLLEQMFQDLGGAEPVVTEGQQPAAQAQTSPGVKQGGDGTVVIGGKTYELPAADAVPGNDGSQTMESRYVTIDGKTYRIPPNGGPLELSGKKIMESLLPR